MEEHEERTAIDDKPEAPPGDESATPDEALDEAPDEAPGDGGGQAPGKGGAQPPPARTRRRRIRGRNVLVFALALLLVGGLGIAGALWAAVEHYTGSVHRIPNVFPSVPAKDQPQQIKGKGTNFLLVGLDSRSDLPTTGKDAKAPQWRPGAQRSDTMMLLHIPANHRNAYVVSLPRDSWVKIPDHGKAKLNAAFSWGGPPLLIDTVQRLTDIRVDHLMVIDWSGFRKLTDAVGGVDIVVDKDIPTRPGERGWTSGKHHMYGEEALVYVRERHGLPNGDLDRTKRQQNFLRSLLRKTLDAGTLSNPLKLRKLLDQVTDVVSVDDRLSNGALRDLVWSMRNVRPGNMVFMNAPVGGFDQIKGQSVVLLDDNDAGLLWDAIRTDTMADYTANRSVDQLTENVP
ncbi:LCP family protein [Wenjunlia tyrosinilytica]|uniref:LCP family protein n=1 Tax=Wenjunlia tyrosinilytica TaxID=1544741 RepID=UPI001E526905|nr:LCP family protein [Wenjunlia tyrosinilytica]